MSFWDSLTGSPNKGGDNIDAGGGFNPATGQAGQTTGGVIDTISGILAPEKIRTQISGLYAGGIKSFLTGKAPGINIKPLGAANNTGSAADVKDWRVRISLPPKSALHYDNTNPFLNILSRTDGVVFPYTPNITVSHNARYQEQSLTHSNYKNYFYEGSDVSAINIVGDFTVQNKDDALYVLAAVYFFRSCTKMFFGADANAGNPPPIVYLDGYGDYYFPHVTSVVTSFQHTMPADVDYIEVAYSQGSDTKIVGTSYVSNKNRQTARVPVTSQFNVTLQPIYSRNATSKMTLGNFSQGKLLKGKGGFI